MATLVFTQNLRRHVDVERMNVSGRTVAEVLEGAFDRHPRLRGYLLDDTGAVRTHVVILLDGQSIQDRQHLSDEVPESARIFVMQALSGG